jgi:hypothetical protein
MREFISIPEKPNGCDAETLCNAPGNVIQYSMNHQFNKRKYFSILRNAWGVLAHF